ncbi:MAG: PEP-CTERM sorting domain-containing protein [Planctomycetaceae bacterium]|nr:PEP-CTERM sorting domain-containing protein [Planctomycetaceae bacterium]
MNLQGTPGSSSFSLSFDGTLTAVGTTLTEFHFTGFSPFVNAPFGFQSITGSTQVSGSFSPAALSAVRAPSTAFLVVDVFPDQFTTGGETLTLSGSGTFTIPGLTFDDFTPGTYTGISDGFLLPTGNASLVISSLPSAAVPEPSTVVLFTCVLMGIIVVRPRWLRSELLNRASVAVSK